MGLGTALHSESCEPLVIYRTLYDNDLSSTWARPKEMFHEEVSPGVKRFTEVARVRISVPEDEAILSSLERLEDPLGGSARSESGRSYQEQDLARATRYLLELPDGDTIATVAARRLARRVIELCSLSVKPSHWKQGYGSALVRVVMDIFRMEDKDVRFVGILRGETRLFERLGFCVLPDLRDKLASGAVIYSGASPLTDSERLSLSCLLGVRVDK